MKKLFIMLFALSITTAIVNAEPVGGGETSIVQQKIAERRMHRDNMFEKRLGLTEVQKLKARQIRQSGHEKLTPVLEKIKNKKQEAEMIRRSRLVVQMQEEKLAVIDAELKVLEKEANNIRKANMKEFESILTRQQKKILKEMKKEGRQRYHSQHPTNMERMMPNMKFVPNAVKTSK